MGRTNSKHDVFRYIDMSAGADECWPWKGGTGGGTAKGKPRPYFTVAGRKYIAYRLVWELVHGEAPKEDEFLCHKCDNTICCNPRHLEIGSHEENMADMVARDRHGLSHDAVRRIRLMLMSQKLTHAEIAQFVGTSPATVGRIARDEMHTHKEDYPATTP